MPFDNSIQARDRQHSIVSMPRGSDRLDLRLDDASTSSTSIASSTPDEPLPAYSRRSDWRMAGRPPPYTPRCPDYISTLPEMRHAEADRKLKELEARVFERKQQTTRTRAHLIEKALRAKERGALFEQMKVYLTRMLFEQEAVDNELEDEAQRLSLALEAFQALFAAKFHQGSRRR